MIVRSNPLEISVQSTVHKQNVRSTPNPTLMILVGRMMDLAMTPLWSTLFQSCVPVHLLAVIAKCPLHVTHSCSRLQRNLQLPSSMLRLLVKVHLRLLVKVHHIQKGRSWILRKNWRLLLQVLNLKDLTNWMQPRRIQRFYHHMFHGCPIQVSELFWLLGCIIVLLTLCNPL